MVESSLVWSSLPKPMGELVVFASCFAPCEKFELLIPRWLDNRGIYTLILRPWLRSRSGVEQLKL